MNRFSLLAGVALLCAAMALAAPITSMPGLNAELPSKMYSGYITVDQAKGRKIFYMFAESQRDPAKDPLVLWLTGGPGCSGILAMFTEHGVFNMNFTAGGNGVELNPYSWNTVANMIYIESPVGVGYSYGTDPALYATGDKQTAEDTYNFLQGFLAEFPQFRTNDFWVTGESYGGHYVPEISSLIVEKNAQVSADKKIGLVGLMAGNPWTYPAVEAWGVVDNWWQRGMISEVTYDDIYRYCDYKDITFWIINNVTLGAHRGLGLTHNPERFTEFANRREALGETPFSAQCFTALHQGSVVEFGDVDILGVYLDMCNAGTNGAIPDQPNYCANNQMVSYMNLPAVQKALNVDTTATPTWAPCSNFVNHHYNSTDTETSMIPHYQVILKAEVSVLIYSGDNDAIVPTTGTRRWINPGNLGIKIVNNTHTWAVDTNGMQVGGWAVQYDKMTFTTVRDAGHMVPYMQPKRALYMFENFIKNRKL